jgi:hypothetical protein
LTLDYGLWNVLVSTATLIVVAATAAVALRQIRQLRAQTTLAGLLKVLEDWRDPTYQAGWTFVITELPGKLGDPAFVNELDQPGIDRSRHPELDVCDWYEQIGSYMKYGLLDERMMMDVSATSCNRAWHALEPVVMRMRRTRDQALYENFEYMAARGVLFQRAHPRGCYPRDTPRMAQLGGAHIHGQRLHDVSEEVVPETV